jgi:hypothetical protein
VAAVADTEPTNTERGFGTGLRAKLSNGGGAPEEPRSPGEAIKAAASPDVFEVDALKAELSASLAREQELRASLTGHLDPTDAEELVREHGQRVAELDHRAATLSQTEAALEEREREVSDRLG